MFNKYIKIKKKCSNIIYIVIPYLLLLVVPLIIFMGVISQYNSHPDENVHIEAAKFYRDYWLPPSVGDERTLDSYSIYGHSRLNELDVYYFLAGKVSVLVNPIFQNVTFSLRFFNILLFIILVILCFKSTFKNRLFFLFLLISPQVWYLFSYVNSDAFTLFLSILIVYQILDENSLLYKYLTSDSNNPKRAVLFALLLALLFLSKKNYYVIFLVVVFKFIWMVFSLGEGERKKYIVKTILLVGLVLAFILPRYALDIGINGFDKGSQLSILKETMAGDQYKPSARQSINAEGDSVYFGLNLRRRGVKYIQLFSERWSWHRISFESFVGIYGYMNIRGPTLYYKLMLFLYLVALLYSLFCVFFQG